MDPAGLAVGAGYAATVVRVVDGDTLVLAVNLGLARFGLDLWLHNVKVRLAGCNAAESGTPAGAAAAANLATMLPPGTAVTVAPVRVDEYGGRVDAAVAVAGVDLARTLIDTHWAAAWSGRGAKPVPPWPRPEDQPPRSAMTELPTPQIQQSYNRQNDGGTPSSVPDEADRGDRGDSAREDNVETQRSPASDAATKRATGPL